MNNNNHYNETQNNNNTQLLPDYPLVNASYAPNNNSNNASAPYNPWDEPSTAVVVSNTEPEIQVPSANANSPSLVTQSTTQAAPVFSNALNSPVPTAIQSTTASYDCIPPEPTTTTPATTGYSTPVATPVSGSTTPAYPEERLRRMKQFRLQRQKVATITYGAIGLIFLGPVGAVLGGYTGNALTKATGRRLETRVKEEYYRQATEAATANAVKSRRSRP